MTRRSGVPALTLAWVLGACATPWGPAAPPPAPPGYAVGTVFVDRDGDGRRGASERGVARVAVSNGRDVARTNAQGHYRLPVGDDSVLFVVQPRGYRVPLDANGVPRFYYVHKPFGSPDGLRFPGVAPTGPLPPRVDFVLHPGPDDERFSVLLLGDPQVRDTRDLGFLAQDVVAPLVDADADLAIALGDLVYDDLDLLEPTSRVLGRLRVPWWSVIGNHDVNQRARRDVDSDETWTRVFGPTSYAFQVGRVHFVVLDSDRYEGWDARSGTPGRYRKDFADDALAFVESYLATTPPEDRVVVAMHIPLGLPGGERTPGSRRLLALLSGREHTLSFSGHAHRQFQLFLGAEDGFTNAEPHHHVSVGATSGGWWLGALDEAGIPHATMRDGAPNGVWFAHFDGTDYRLEFRPARRPAAYQIQVVAPFRVGPGAAPGEVLANVFAGSERTEVAMQVDAGAWLPMQRVARRDPLYEHTFRREREARPARSQPVRGHAPSSHVWTAPLPPAVAPGAHVLTVRAIDPYAGTLIGRHVFEVAADANDRPEQDRDREAAR